MTALGIVLLVFAGLWLSTIIASTAYTYAYRESGGSGLIGVIALGWGWPIFFFILWPYLYVREWLKERFA